MKKYLATVAAVGLIAGLGAAQAQSPGSMEKKDAPGASTSSPGGSGAQPSQPSPMQKQSPAQAAPDRGQTTGQAPSSGAPKADSKAGATTDTKSGDTKSGDTKSGMSPDTKSGTSAGTKSDTKSGSSAQTDTKSGTSTTGAAGSGSINLTAQQKTEIRTKVLASAPKVTNVNFSLNVGTVVPRTVSLVAVPETIVVIHPQWRGYRYFVVRDEIVIVEPDTLKIVAVLEV